IAAALVSCGRQETPLPSKQTTVAPRSEMPSLAKTPSEATSPLAATPPAGAAVQTPQPSAEEIAAADYVAGKLAMLNMMVTEFGLTHNRPLKSLDELVALKLLDQVPPAPPGKQFALDPKTQKVALTAK
ncbi:MAG: hypothetical protein HYZ36_04680, partial [Pedosphaera parvula]|nr:hypothetical protein [Pedosphaera parvula]